MITDYIPHGHKNAISRTQLSIRSGMSDRKCRRLIEQARLAGNIILCASDGSGYFLYDGEDDDYYLHAYRKQEAMRFYSIGKTLRILNKADKNDREQIPGQISLFGSEYV